MIYLYKNIHVCYNFLNNCFFQNIPPLGVSFMWRPFLIYDSFHKRSIIKQSLQNFFEGYKEWPHFWEKKFHWWCSDVLYIHLYKFASQCQKVCICIIHIQIRYITQNIYYKYMILRNDLLTSWGFKLINIKYY